MVRELIDKLIHPSVRRDSAAYTSSRMLVVVMLCFLFILISYTSYYVANGIVLEEKAFYNYFGLFIISACILYIRKTGKIKMPLRIISGFGFMLISLSVYLSGGIYSNDLHWYIVASVSAMMFIGLKDGLVAGLISLLCIGTFYGLEILEIKDFSADNLSTSLSYKVTNTIFVLSSMLLMLFILVRGNQRLQKQLERTKEKQVREEVARDFHDQMGNKLASLGHLAHLVKQTGSEQDRSRMLAKIEGNSKAVYENFKDFIWMQNPESDYLDELFMYLKDFVEDLIQFSPVEFVVETRPEVLPRRKMLGASSREVLPLFKESITNAYKHAEAERFVLRVAVVNDEVSFNFEDDGKGFDATEIQSGNGLINMNRRAERMQGQLKIDSVVGKGTRIQLKLKLPPQGSPEGEQNANFA